MPVLQSLPELWGNKFFPYVPPFENGERMDQPTFHALYETTPKGFRAELINGVVHMPSPVRMRHGGPQSFMAGLLFDYCSDTDGTETFSDITAILSKKNEPQPDVALLIYPEIGGQTRVNKQGYLTGAPELAVEIAHSSLGIDMNEKKREYERYGVLEYVVVAIKPKTVHYFVRSGARFVPHRLSEDGYFKSKCFPGLWVDPVAVFLRKPTQLQRVLKMGLSSPEHATFAAKLKAKLDKKGLS